MSFNYNNYLSETLFSSSFCVSTVCWYIVTVLDSLFEFAHNLWISIISSAVGIRLIVRLRDLSLYWECLPWGASFLKILDPTYPCFGEKNTKNWERFRSTNTTKDWTWYLPSISAEPLRHWWDLSIIELNLSFHCPSCHLSVINLR